MSERRCPKCASVYGDTARFCPRDGSMLVEVQAPPPSRSGAAPAASPGASGGGTAVRTPKTPKPGLDRASSLSGQVLDSRYQVQKKLGEGGMSYVYLAREVATGHDVAIKVLSPKLATDRSSVERLRRRVMHYDFADPGEDPLNLTISIGLASFPDDRVSGADSFVALADQALYRAKNEGRNLVRQ